MSIVNKLFYVVSFGFLQELQPITFGMVVSRVFIVPPAVAVMETLGVSPTQVYLTPSG